MYFELYPSDLLRLPISLFEAKVSVAHQLLLRALFLTQLMYQSLPGQQCFSSCRRGQPDGRSIYQPCN